MLGSRHDPARAPDGAGDTPRGGRARGLEGAAPRSWTPPSSTWCKQDPFSGHVVLRSTDASAAGHDFRLWTTLKVPQGYSLQKHCE